MNVGIDSPSYLGNVLTMKYLNGSWYKYFIMALAWLIKD